VVRAEVVSVDLPPCLEERQQLLSLTLFTFGDCPGHHGRGFLKLWFWALRLICELEEAKQDLVFFEKSHLPFLPVEFPPLFACFIIP